MPWSKPCGGAWRRNVMITIGQLATLALLSTLASWEPLGPNKGRTGLTNACAPGLPTRQSLCQTAIPAQTPVTKEQLLLPSCHCLWARGASPVASACLPAARSWRNCPRNWRKQDMDTTRIPPGCAPSGRPIERTVPHLLIDSRPGPKSGGGIPTDDSTYIATLSGVPQCEGSSSFRWSWGRQLPCLSATTSSAEAKRSSGHRWEAGTYSQVESMCQEIVYASLQ